MYIVAWSSTHIDCDVASHDIVRYVELPQSPACPPCRPLAQPTSVPRPLLGDVNSLYVEAKQVQTHQYALISMP